MERLGPVHVLPDDVDTDQILPGEFLTTVPNDELGDYALRGYDPDFADRIDDGDILVAGSNFGLGSSRESAPVALRNAGVGAVVASSFARIFYRNAINVGLPIAVVPDITDHVEPGDSLRVDIAHGEVENLSTGEVFPTSPLPPDLLEILEAGGLVAYRRQKRSSEKARD